ncbi:hypothetical protein L1887_10320 [Cichorium endivia]|nr:hypothetical protein L1887_10320 [Cichorium endivia]
MVMAGNIEHRENEDNCLENDAAFPPSSPIISPHINPKTSRPRDYYWNYTSAVAGEAIVGWVPQKSDSFERYEKIGQGTYSSVYRARDLRSGKMVALKKDSYHPPKSDSANPRSNATCGNC